MRSSIPLYEASGSSPLTRGTRTLSVSDDMAFRFIPAYAGNSLQNVACMDLMPVHPRLRGELVNGRSTTMSFFGSSPLTRGTRLSKKYIRFQKRFIPAYAGNSLKQGIEHLTNSSKDFLSGKYAKNPETVLNHFKDSSLD